MLEHTFIHIPGVGPKTERHLWRNGILTWKQFLKNKETTPLSPSRDTFVRQNLEASLENRDNIRFFQDRLSSADMWRVFDRFKDKAAYMGMGTILKILSKK